MRPYCAARQLTAALFCGLIFLALAVGANFFFSRLMDRQLRLNLPLRPNASSTAAKTAFVDSFKLWKDIPFPVKNRFYFFHVENPMEVREKLVR